MRRIRRDVARSERGSVAPGRLDRRAAAGGASGPGEAVLGRGTGARVGGPAAAAVVAVMTGESDGAT